MLKKIILLSFIYSSLNAQTIDLDLNDISVLLPLPSANEWGLLPKADTQGARGVLLPKNLVVEKIPILLQMVHNESLYPLIYSVGFRIDPCFHEGPAPVKCKTQIRMIWQPLLKRGEQTFTTDVTLHTFYEIAEVDFKKLINEIKQLKLQASVTTDGAALSINPVLKKEGLRGPYYTKLMSIIYKYIGEENLSRITFMQLFGGETVWFFGGIDIKNNEVTRVTIPRINHTIQQFANTQIVFFKGGIAPEPRQSDNLNIVLGDSEKLTAETHEQEIINAVKSAFKFENPHLHNPGTLDCVSCHVAQPVKDWAFYKFPQLNLAEASREFTYQSDKNLANLTPVQQTNIARIFGYFEDQPITAQRVINESAEVVKHLKANY